MNINSRDHHLKNIRPEVSSAQIFEATSSIEAFQNGVLRPILKFQNNLLVQLFLSGIHLKNQTSEVVSLEEKQKLITNQFKTNTTLKQLLLGCVIGLLSVEEFEFYKTNSSSLNKRIFSMLKDRLIDQWP